MPPPYSNSEYLEYATGVTQFKHNGRNVVVLTNGTQGLKSLLSVVEEGHEGWDVIHADATKSIEGHTLADEGKEGEGEVNLAAAINIAAALKSRIKKDKDTVFVINCKAGQVRSVTLAAHLRAACQGETARNAYDEFEFRKKQSEKVKERVFAGL